MAAPVQFIPVQFNIDDVPQFASEAQHGIPVSLPGCPEISMQNLPQLVNYLSQDLMIPDLDGISPWLWWAGGIRIAPLTEHIFRNRRIAISENPHLHMVIEQNRAFFKPIPVYLFSWRFWTNCLKNIHEARPERFLEIRQVALGLLRSYSHLIQRQSDFILAKECRLLPEEITYLEFSRFIHSFGDILDSEVSPRQRFGHLSLTRLNILGSVFLRSSMFHITPNYVVGSAFVFGFLSLILSAMQVILAGPAFVGQGDAWEIFARVSTYFSVTTLVFLAVGAAFFLTYFLWSIFYWAYAVVASVLFVKRVRARLVFDRPDC